LNNHEGLMIEGLMVFVSVVAAKPLCGNAGTPRWPWPSSGRPRNSQPQYFASLCDYSTESGDSHERANHQSHNNLLIN
jgi:hypothetical protein